jgi:hypothetical protein
VGDCILRACGIVPDGMLVFLQSYRMLDRLVMRWKVRCAVQLLLGTPAHQYGTSHESNLESFRTRTMSSSSTQQGRGLDAGWLAMRSLGSTASPGFRVISIVFENWSIRA